LLTAVDRRNQLGQETDYLPVVEELDKLAWILSSIALNCDERSEVAARLEAIMREFRADRPLGCDPEIVHKLDMATDVMSLIGLLI